LKKKAHNRTKISKSSQDWCDLKNIVARFKKLYRLKLKQFFSNCKSKDFKSSKKFWEFYSNVFKVKSVKKINDIPLRFSDRLSIADSECSIAELFNNYFSNIFSNSTLNINEFISYIDSRFSKLFNNQLLKNPLTEFSFIKVKQSELEYIIKNLNKNCFPGNYNIYLLKYTYIIFLFFYLFSLI